jgi:hypothetical protein
VNSVTKFCSVGRRALSVNANTASHDSGSTISTVMKAANSHRTGRVKSMRDFGVSAVVMVVIVVMRKLSPSFRVWSFGRSRNDGGGYGGKHPQTLNSRA